MCQPVVLEWILLGIVGILTRGLILIRSQLMHLYLLTIALSIECGLHLLHDSSILWVMRNALRVDAVELPVAVLCDVVHVSRRRSALAYLFWHRELSLHVEESFELGELPLESHIRKYHRSLLARE